MPTSFRCGSQTPDSNETTGMAVSRCAWRLVWRHPRPRRSETTTDKRFGMAARRRTPAAVGGDTEE